MNLRCFSAAIAIAASLSGCVSAPRISTHDAGTRVYLMRGVGGILLSSGMDQIGARLQDRAAVQVGDWSGWKGFAEDAAQHPRDRLIFAGHSMGAWGAVQAANWLAARGIPAKVVGLDPLCTFPVVGKGVQAVSFYSNGCGAYPGTMIGAHNVYVGSYDHINIGSHVEIQDRMIAAILGG